MSLYRNIQKKRARIKAGSGEKMRSKGAKGAPTKKQFDRAKRTAKKKQFNVRNFKLEESASHPSL